MSLVIPDSSTLYAPPAVDLSNNSSTTDGKVRVSVKDAFFSTSLAFAFNIGFMTFIGPTFSAVAITLATAGVGIYVIYSLAKEFFGFGSNSITAGDTLAKFSLVNFIGQYRLNTFIHEVFGHAFWAKLLIKDPNITISIVPFVGGSTGYTLSNGLTYLGQKLGKELSKNIIAAGGFIASTVFATGEIIVAHLSKESYPEVSSFLSLHAASQLLGDILYGLTAFITSKKMMSHDFVYLWVVAGINPIVPVLVMIGLPLSVQLFLSWLEKRRAGQEEFYARKSLLQL